VLRVPKARRDAAIAHLRGQGIGCAVYYPIPFHRQPCFQYLGANGEGLPGRRAGRSQALALPIFQGLTEGEQIDVVGALAKFVR
jgi:dTDP-4-amino-4,6-dideoxygalactose transaminase